MTTLNTPPRAQLRRRSARLLASLLAVVLISSGIVAEASPERAAAANGAAVVIDKDVNGVKELHDVLPGALLTYTVDFAASDDDADGPVHITDQLPEEFAGWQITGLSARYNGSTTGITLDLPGVTAGAAPATSVAGTLSADPAELMIAVDVALPVFAGVGNDSGMGLPTGGMGTLEYTILVPPTLATDDPILRTDLVNSALITAFAGQRAISSRSQAVVQLDNPVVPQVAATKTWTPAAQNFEPGILSTIALGATQTSNISVGTIELQDPADPALTPANAATLPTENPFNLVDFVSFASPTDPTTNLPAGADDVGVEVYHFDGSVWNWVPWADTLSAEDIAGIRMSFTSADESLLPNAVVAQGFTVAQRATHRATGDPLADGWNLTNTSAAAVRASGQADVTAQASAEFDVISTQVDVRADKKMYLLPAGAESGNLVVSAGDSVGVVLRASNRELPFSTTLDSLLIVEPARPADVLPETSPEYFGENLAFGAFDNSNLDAIWPMGATGGELTWITESGRSTVSLVAGAALPAPVNAADVQGFEIEFTGAIEPAATSEVRYRIDTNGSEDFIAGGSTNGPYLNRVSVTGSADDLDPATSLATSQVRLTAPKIQVGITKRVGPQTAIAGQPVYVQLDTSVEASGSSIVTSELVIEDSLSAARDTLPASTPLFWDAFDLTQILPPITRPLSGGSPSSAADLRIEYADGDGDWLVLATNPNPNVALSVPAGATGIRFVYSHPQGLAQTTLLKPNLAFTTREFLRDDATTPTGGEFENLTYYSNAASAEGTASLGDRDILGTDSDTVRVGVRGSQDGTGPSSGSGAWAAKSWNDSVLTSQSNAATYSTQQWAVVDPGFSAVTLQDPGVLSATGQGSVFEAFNLTHIRPIRGSGTLANSTLDARLKWDRVNEVQLHDGTAWVSVPAPGGSWMTADGSGFKGYTLTDQEQASTVGARLVLGENAEARQAAADAGDITAPRVGSGVSASADIRSYRLDWQLRQKARGVATKWVTGESTFNCSTAGCVENSHAVVAQAGAGPDRNVVATATIELIDGRVNVGATKQVRALNPLTGLPVGNGVASLPMVVPNASDEIAPETFPKARFTIVGSNNSEAPAGSVGAMQLAKLRLTDPVIAGDPAPSANGAPFTGRDFAAEAQAKTNPFDRLNIVGLSYGAIPAYIDTAESMVSVWTYDEITPAGTAHDFTLAQVVAQDPAFAALLPDAVGVSTVFSVQDPETNGNGIPIGVPFTMNLDVQLRDTYRLSGDPMVGGTFLSPETAENNVFASGWDAVLSPESVPAERATASLALTQSAIGVSATKSLSVSHGATRNQTIYEAEPDALVQVALNAQSNGSTAPIQMLDLEDDTPGFWERFQLVSVSALVLPIGADHSEVSVKVGTEWVAYDDFAGELSEVTGIRVVFTRTAGNQLFPEGAASWSTSWRAASLPFTVMLRDDASVDWLGDSQDNVMEATVTHPTFENVTDDATNTVVFSPGTHSLRVEKRAPNDTGLHQAEPLVSLPWDLTFTNTGNSLLPISQVTDQLPASLTWTGEDSQYIGVPGTRGQSGLTSDATEIVAELSADQREMTFTWPEGQRMTPGESMTVRVFLELEPTPVGLQTLNTVVVETGVPLASCLQPTNFGQQPQAPTADNTCSNRNFVVPRLGNAVGGVKAVQGESVDTLGEDLVQGGVNVRTNEACTLPKLPLFAEGFTRFPCASYTTLGATDSWSLQNANVGSNPLGRMVIVDMLPTPGDRLLSGGSSRESTFRPVLVGADLSDVFRFDGLPDGAVVNMDVTTNPAACVGQDPDTSLWGDDPTCENQTTNPANVWVSAASFAGELADIAGVRFDILMDEQPLKPAQVIGIEFETVNRAGDGTNEQLVASLEQFQEEQFVWNQDGIVAWNTEGVRVTLPIAHYRAGVVVETGDLVVSKDVLGEGAAFAPESFTVELSCTVPNGDPATERSPLDLGAFAQVTVPANGSITVPNLPIGTNCRAEESGDVGEFGEAGRSISAEPGVIPASDGLSADIEIREQDSRETQLRFANTFTVSGVTVEKAVLSTNAFPVTSGQRDADYPFTLRCTAPGSGEALVRDFVVRGGTQHTVADLPDGALCSLTETDARGAAESSITVAGNETTGTTVSEFEIIEGGVHALVSNQFVGISPLENTGSSSERSLVILLVILLMGGGLWAFIATRERTRKLK